VAGVAFSAIALWLVFSSNHDTHPAFGAALNLVVAWSFIASGLVAWTRRPDNRFGVLMTAVGLTWFIGALSESNDSIPYTVGIVLGLVGFAIFVHALLAFPRGYLETRIVYLTVGTAYAIVTVGQVVAALFYDPTPDCRNCPANALQVVDHNGVTTALNAVLSGLGVLVVGATVFVLVRRWRAASTPLRRALAPVLATGAVTMFLLALLLVLELAHPGAANVVSWVTLFAFASVPLAFLAGLVRSRLAREAVGRLVVALGRARAPGEVRDALADALGDPSLEVAYWLPEQREFFDLHGRRLPLPANDGARWATIVEWDGKRVAAILHDHSLLEDPALVEAAGAAAGLALESERRVAALAESEWRNRALLDAIPDLMFRLSRAGEYLEFKGRAEDVAASPETLIGRTIFDTLPADVASLLAGCIERTLESKELQRVEYDLTLDGRRRSFEGRAVVSGPDEVLLIVRDFTERRRQEAELEALHAELRDRLEELGASRQRIVEAGDVERRRLERNLHDGAQQRLVAVSLTLRLAEGKVATDPGVARQLLGTATEELAIALEELRELARGIHPGVLSERGLEPALGTLVARAPLPVEVDVPLDGRLPGPVEAAAYYVISEALTNIAKYAEASAASVRVSRRNGAAVVEVADDGIGGADPNRGTGLRGLADRVEALDGRLEVQSVPGQGTRVRAVIPCGS